MSYTLNAITYCFCLICGLARWLRDYLRGPAENDAPGDRAIRAIQPGERFDVTKGGGHERWDDPVDHSDLDPRRSSSCMAAQP